MTLRTRLAIAALLVVVVAGVGLNVVAARFGPWLKQRVVDTLSARLDSHVTLDTFDVVLLPRPHVSGRGLVIRHQGRVDIPPLVSVQSFNSSTSWRAAFRRHVEQITLDGLEFTIPPRRRADMPSLSRGSDDGAPAEDSGGGKPPFTVDRMDSTNARLSILPKQAGKDPRVFDIFNLRIDQLDFVSPFTYQAALTNPIPFGRVDTVGRFGPWQKGEPGATPLGGEFAFSADLGTVKGIAGALSASGTFDGPLDRIVAKGQSSTPDFRVPKLQAASLPLYTTFDAVIDGTKGDVTLTKVDFTLGHSSFVASGDIVGTKGLKGKRVVLSVRSVSALMEDMLRFTVKQTPPLMTGKMGLQAAFDLPQGQRDGSGPDVLDRLQLEGTVTVAQGHFTSDNIQDKVDSLSRRGRGRPADMGIDGVASNLKTAFKLGDGVLRLTGLSYRVQGATVNMAGTYALERRALNFEGVARLQASLSNTQTGFKHFVLKPFDPLFRRKGAGTRVVIEISGTADDPKFGVNVGRTLKGK